MPRAALTAVACAALVLPFAAACVANAPAGTPTVEASALKVDSSAAACTLSAATAPSGTLTFSVTNSGTDVTEFYVLAADGLQVVAELENLGPGLTRDLVVQARPGTYVTQCKPGMVGEGIRSGFTVTDSGTPVGPTGDAATQLAEADESSASYVEDQVGALISGGGSYLVARRIRMVIELNEADLAATGRGDVPLITATWRVRNARPSTNGGVRMLRRGDNFTDGNASLGRIDAGLFCIADVRDPRTHYIPMQTTLPRGDALMEYLLHTGSGLFAVPPGLPAKLLAADGTPATGPDAPYVDRALFT